MYSFIRAKRERAVLEAEKFDAYGLEYLTFPSLSKIEQINHLFTTRLGGVSDREFSTMNLSFTRGDEKEAVLENYRRIGQVLGCEVNSIVCSDQTHTTNIRKVGKEDGGKGVLRDRDYTDIDGLITDEEGVALACFFADCVPLYFVDPKKKVIGLAHSGWKGTVGKMGGCMVDAMKEAYSCENKDLIVAVGPSICRDCYEVSEDVALRFKETFEQVPNTKAYEEELKFIHGFEHTELLVPGREEGKYQLDLWVANYFVLREAGVKPEHIEITDVCTCCNGEYLFSHRKSMGKRGNLGAFLMLRKDS